MNPKKLIEYAKLWGWSRDDMLVAAHQLLQEVTQEHEIIKNVCAICGGDKTIFGNPCGACE